MEQEEAARIAEMVGDAVRAYREKWGESPGGILAPPSLIPEGYTEVMGIPVIVSKWTPLDALYLIPVLEWAALTAGPVWKRGGFNSMGVS